MTDAPAGVLARPGPRDRRSAHVIRDATIVVFGASGDLMRRKLGPALFRLHRQGRLADDVLLLGSARTAWSDAEFRSWLREELEADEAGFDAQAWEAFEPRLHYEPGDLTDQESFARVDARVSEIEGADGGGRLYYLAVAPRFFADAVAGLGGAGMDCEERGWRRIVVEKPFGRDLASARALNEEILDVFHEDQVYRIDHYLGKETAQNLVFFRFANTVFEPIWNRNYIDNVQITVAEEVDVGRRAGYYDASGVLRDMFQNHLLQLLTLVAMEPPAPFDARALRDEKVKVLSAASGRPDGLVCAQYDGYRDAEGVADGSRTPTYAALEMRVDNWRWTGVPFYLRSGKALSVKTTEIAVVFKRPPMQMFGDFQTPSPNVLSICIQPDEGFHFSFDAKVPGESDRTTSADLDFHYREGFPDVQLPDAYERLLLDALQGDASLFARRDEVEAAWALIDPLVEACGTGAAPLESYAPGSWGPPGAERMVEESGRVWVLGCGGHP